MTKALAGLRWSGTVVSLPLSWAAAGLNAGRALIRAPLTRNGYALIASTAVSSALGLVFWVLAARLYPADEVGLGGVLISTVIALSAAAQIGIGHVLNRFVPRAGPQARKLILLTYAAGVLGSLLLAAGFLLTVEWLVPELAFITEAPLLAVAFGVLVAVWTVLALQDTVLAALRQSVWVLIENSAFSATKITLLFVFLGVAGSGLGIFAAWMAPLVVFVSAVNALIFVRLLPAHTRTAAPSHGIDVRAVARYFGWNYLGSLSTAAAVGIAPIMVLAIAGPETSASYVIAWPFTYALYLLARSMGISLLTESTHDEKRLPSLAADAVVHTVVPLAAAALVLALGAPLLLAAFGPTYVRDATALLQVLVISSVPWSLVTLFLAVARARNWNRTIAAVQIATAVLVLGLGALLLPVLGAFGMGLAWLAAHTLVLIGIAVGVAWRSGPDRLLVWLLSLATSTARIAASFTGRHAQSPLPPSLQPAIESALRQAQTPGAAGLQVMGVAPTQSDMLVCFLAKPGETQARAVLKVSSSKEGRNSLRRGCETQAMLSADARFAGLGFDLPRTLLYTRDGDVAAQVETAIDGEDGRQVLGRQDTGPAALCAAAEAIVALHDRSSRLTTLDADWTAQWIDAPVALVRKQSRKAETRSPRHAAWEQFCFEQHAFWSGRITRLGISHGDFSPGNILFGRGGEAGTPPAHAATVRLAGIVDWDRARTDAPAGFDLCHLVLTTRMLTYGSELGPLVRELLQEPHWDAAELELLKSTTSPGSGALDWQDRSSTRAIVGLTWLHHIMGNLEKSRRYASSRLWAACNLDLVLRAYVGREGPS